MARILIVEDEKVLNEAYQVVLKQHGYDVVAAYNGEEALEAFKKTVPDLVLLDLRMPRMNGVEFLKKLKPAQNYPQTQIIIFSNYDEQHEVDEALKSGADRYILKAWSSPKELVKIVDEAVSQPAKNKD